MTQAGPRELPVSRACAAAAGLGRPRAQPEGNASAPIARLARPAADAETQALLVVEHNLGFIIMHTNDDSGCGIRVRRLRDPSHTGIRVLD